MKKINIIIALLIAVLAPGFVACKKDAAEEAGKSLASAVEKLNLPQELKDGVTLSSCSYADKVLTFVCDVDKAQFKDIDADKSKTGTIDRLKTNILPRNLVEKVKEAGASIKYVFVCDTDTLSYEITSSELQPGN